MSVSAYSPLPILHPSALKLSHHTPHKGNPMKQLKLKALLLLAVYRLDLLEECLTKPSPSRQLTPQQVATITSDLQALFKPNAS